MAKQTRILQIIDGRLVFGYLPPQGAGDYPSAA